MIKSISFDFQILYYKFLKISIHKDCSIQFQYVDEYIHTNVHVCFCAHVYIYVYMNKAIWKNTDMVDTVHNRDGEQPRRVLYVHMFPLYMF